MVIKSEVSFKPMKGLANQQQPHRTTLLGPRRPRPDGLERDGLHLSATATGEPGGVQSEDGSDGDASARRDPASREP